MKYRNILKTAVIVIFASVLSVNAFSFKAHKYHTSLTRIDYNADEKLVEITIQLFTHDLVSVMEKQTKNSINLDKKGEIDKVLLDYLNLNFVLRQKNSPELQLKWVGKESKVDQTYVFVEIPFEGKIDELELKNSIFFESFREQTNLVIFNNNAQKADLLFKVGDKFKEIKLKNIER